VGIRGHHSDFVRDFSQLWEYADTTPISYVIPANWRGSLSATLSRLRFLIDAGDTILLTSLS